MRFIHCADIHLDSPLVGLASRADAPRDALTGATRRAFSALVDFALRETVDFVVIAGDLYDGDWRDYTTGLFFVREMGRLARAGIPAFVLHGNHDAESQLTRSLTLPPNVTVFPADRPESITVDGLPVVLHGQSFASRAVTDNLAARYPDPVAGAFNIGVLHTAADGREGHDSYAPCRTADLIARDYQYWALGHVHAREELSREPYIVFPGNLQGRHIRETGPKGFSLVTVADGRVLDVTPVPVDSVRWARVTVDLTGAEDFDAVLRLIRPALGEAVDRAEGRILALRLVLTGTTAAHFSLKAQPERLTNECIAAALPFSDRVWIEKVRVQTAPPGERSLSADAVGTLLATIDGLAGDDGALTGLRAELSELIGRLPPDLRRRMQQERGAPDPALVEDVLAEARLLIGHRILGGEQPA